MTFDAPGAPTNAVGEEARTATFLPDGLNRVQKVTRKVTAWGSPAGGRAPRA